MFKQFINLEVKAFFRSASVGKSIALKVFLGFLALYFLLSFLQAGPLISVRLPVDKDSKRQKTFAFVRFQHEESVPFAIDMFRYSNYILGDGLSVFCQ